MADKRIKEVKLFKNDTQYGAIYNATIRFEIDPVMTIFFQVKRMTKQDGSVYYLWPQEIWNAELAKQTNYAKGVNKFLFGNKAFGTAIQEAIEEEINGGVVGIQPQLQPVQEQNVSIENVNFEEIKF